VTTPPSGSSDASALEERVRTLVAAGDRRAAATDAIRALGPSILRYLRTVLRDEADAADAFSQFAENLWKGLPTFRGGSALRTWAFRIAWNAALNLRDEAWRRKGRRLATGEASALAEDIRTRTAVRVERQRDALRKLREALTPEEQSLLTLRIDLELSWAEIAEVLAADGSPTSADTVSKRFERLKDRLARMAREQGLLE
jgi:RNA polymerase sigma-70 factor (ECF subfamily)